MPPDLTALFLLVDALSAVTIATIMYVGFPRPEIRFTLVVTLLLVYALLTLAPLVFSTVPPVARSQGIFCALERSCLSALHSLRV